MPALQQTQPVNIQPIPTAESRPVPDPTVLTTDLVLRKNSETKDLLHREDENTRREIAAIERNILSRLEASEKEREKAIKLLQDFANSSPKTAEVDLRVTALSELVDEKLLRVGTQILERDARTEQTSRDNKVAIDAALQAQKEAVGKQNESNALAIAKSEAGFTKQIDQQQQLITANNKATDERINDMKGRLDRIEGQGKASGDIWGYLVGGLGVLFALVTMIFVVLKFSGQGG
jgi:hypothetical protein